ncbi:MAG: hypothetical protein II218_07070, partial [Peptococcaceae bacterium]|nr:hypothetical protein [Peptococcaceae bacterium]
SKAFSDIYLKLSLLYAIVKARRVQKVCMFMQYNKPKAQEKAAGPSAAFSFCVLAFVTAVSCA